MADERNRIVGDLEQGLRGVNEQWEASKKNVKDLTEQYNLHDATLKELIKDANTYKEILSNQSDPKTISQLNEQKKVYKDTTTTLEKVNTTKRKLQKTEKQLQQERVHELQLQKKREKAVDDFNKKELKASQQKRKALIAESSAYARLDRQRTNAQKRLKRYIATYGEFDQRTVKVQKNFDKLNTKWERANRLAKDGHGFVGRYGEAMRNVRDTTVKWAAAIGGAAASLYGLFKIADSQDQLNKRLAGSFDLTGNSLDRVSKKVEFLSKAYDTEVNEVIETAAALTNEFGIESENAFGLIEKGFQKGANVRGEFLEQLKEYSTQFVNVGLSAEEAIAVITQQENKGVFSDKGVDAIKEAGIRLTEMPKSTQEALTAIGMSGQEIQNQITSGQKTVFEVTQEISREISKLPANASEVGQVLADVFGGAGEDAKGFVLELGNLETNLDGLEDTTTDFEKAQQKLIKQFVDVKQTVSNALIPTFTFLADNFKTILKIGGELLAFWLIYKARIKLLEALNGKFGASLKKISEAFKKGTTNGKRFTGSLKEIGKSLKGLGFTAAIAGAIKLGQAFYDSASGARQLRQDTELLNAVTGKFNDEINKNIEARKKQRDQLLDLAKTEADRKKIKEAFIKDNQAEAAALEKTLAKQKLGLEIAKKFQKQQSGFAEFQAEQADQFADFFGVDVRDINDIVGEYEAKVAAAEGGLVALNTVTQEAKHGLKVFNKEVSEGADAVDNNTEAVEEQAKAYKDLGKEIDNILDKGESLTEIEDGEISQEFNKTQKELTKQLTSINDLQRSGELTAEQAAEQRLIAEIESALARKRVLESYGRDTTDIEKELSDKKLQLAMSVEDQITAKQEEEAKRRKELRDKWLAAGKQALTQLGEASAEFMDERISEQDRLIASEQALLETLKQSAKEVTLEQGKSITKQEENIRKAQEEKIRLEKQKQVVEFATAAITTFTNALEAGKSVPEAFGDVALSQAGLELILNQLPKFFHGTEDTGTKGIFSDQYGPVTGVTHKKERVIDAKNNSRLNGKDNNSVVDAAVKYFELENNPTALGGITTDAYAQMLFMPNIPTPIYDDDRLVKEVSGLKSEMQGVNKRLDNLEFPELKIGEVLDDFMKLIETDGKGNTRETVLRPMKRRKRS